MFAVAFIEFAREFPALALSQGAKSDCRKREGQLCGMILGELNSFDLDSFFTCIWPEGQILIHIWDVAVCG
jgi:hypothetical protein